MKQFHSISSRETLPEKVAKTIKEYILSGELKAGEALPTEPELEKQFNVSRAVVRDAVRMLKAQGLVVVKHGKGMFVSFSQTEAFTDALLTSLRRDGASAWDVEQFERLLLPRVFALAAAEASESEIVTIDDAAQQYLDIFTTMSREEITADDETMHDLQGTSQTAFRNFMRTVFSATHNKLIMLLGEVLLDLRKWRTVVVDERDNTSILDLERETITIYVEAVKTNDPNIAAGKIEERLTYDEELKRVMKETPVGESPVIPGDLFFAAYGGGKAPE